MHIHTQIDAPPHTYTYTHPHIYNWVVDLKYLNKMHPALYILAGKFWRENFGGKNFGGKNGGKIFCGLS